MGHTDVRALETLKGLVAAGRDRERTALDVVRRPAPYSYHKFSTNVWKAGNLLGHYGVHSVGEMAVAIGPKVSDDDQSRRGLDGSAQEGRIDAAEPLLAVLGGVIVGATVDLTPTEPVDAPALVAPAHWDVQTAPGCSVLAYGGPPTDPEKSHFERDLWSENPIEPPEPVEPDDDALAFDGDSWTHAELLEVMATVVEDHGIDADTRVVLRASLVEPGGFVAGVLAPLAVGATIVVPEANAGGDESADGGNVVVVTTDGGGENGLSAGAVTRSLRDTRRA